MYFVIIYGCSFRSCFRRWLPLCFVSHSPSLPFSFTALPFISTSLCPYHFRRFGWVSFLLSLGWGLHPSMLPLSYFSLIVFRLWSDWMVQGWGSFLGVLATIQKVRLPRSRSAWGTFFSSSVWPTHLHKQATFTPLGLTSSSCSWCLLSFSIFPLLIFYN